MKRRESGAIKDPPPPVPGMVDLDADDHPQMDEEAAEVVGAALYMRRAGLAAPDEPAEPAADDTKMQELP